MIFVNYLKITLSNCQGPPDSSGGYPFFCFAFNIIRQSIMRFLQRIDDNLHNQWLSNVGRQPE